MIQLNRNKLVFIVFIIIVFFAFINRINFIIGSEIGRGEIVSINKLRTNSSQGPSEADFIKGVSYACFIVRVGGNNIMIKYQGEENLGYKEGDKVRVIYKKENPIDAKIYSFFGFWFSSLAWSVLPMAIVFAAILSFFGKSDLIIISFKGKFGIKKAKVNLKIKPNRNLMEK